MAHDPNVDFYSFSPDGASSPAPSEPTPPLEPLPDPEAVRTARRTVSRIGWGVLVLCLVWQLVVEAVYIVALILAPDVVSSNVFLALASAVPLYAVATPLMYLTVRRMPTAVPERRVAVGKRVLALLPCALTLMIAGNLLGNLVMTQLSLATGYSFSSSLEVSLGMPLWMSALLVVVVGPFFEELIFRKLLIDRLLPLGEFAAVMLTSLLFAVFHFNLYQFFYAGLVGALLALVYLRTGSFGLCVALHACLNFVDGILPTYLMELANYEGLLSLLADENATAEAMAEFVSANATGIFLLLLYFVLLFAAVITGAVLLVVFRKRWKLCRREGELPQRGRSAVLFGNAGMITMLAFSVLLTVLSLIASATVL